MAQASVPLAPAGSVEKKRVSVLIEFGQALPVGESLHPLELLDWESLAPGLEATGLELPQD